MRNLASSLWRRVKIRLLPHSSGPEVAQREYVLNLALLGLAGSGFLFGLASTMLWALDIVPAAAVGALAGFVVQPFYALAYWLGRRGRVRLASYVPLSILFMVMVSVNWLMGLGHATLVGFAMVVVLAGILAGIRAAVVFVLLCAGAYGIVGWLQLEARLPWSVSPQETLWADEAALTLGLVAVAIFSWLVTRQLHAVLRRSLAQLQCQSQELEAAYEEKQRLAEEVQAQHEEQLELRKVLQRLSASLIPVTDKILIMPIAGVVDPERMEQVATGLLDGVVERRARVVIVDLTGVSRFGAGAIEGLIEVTRAVRLLGCELFLVGMPLHIADGLASQEPLLRKVIILGDLQDGIAYALARLGQRIVTTEQTGELKPLAGRQVEVKQ
jgi:anti-anti-sigma regulatory factor